MDRETGEPGRRDGFVRVHARWAAGALALVFCAGLGGGWLLGHASGTRAGLAAVQASGLLTRATGSPGEPSAAPTDVDPTPFDPADVSSWELLHAFATRVTSLEALLEEARRRNIEPRAIADNAIARLPEDQLRAILARTLRLGPEELSQIEDVHGYASRLASVAMDGVFAGDPEAGDHQEDAARTVFTRDLDPDDPGSLAEDVFRTDAGRIYAVFPLPDDVGEKVMLKWYRTDRPELILFRHYRAAAGEPYGWIWREKLGGWTPGEYRVDVFTGDERVELIASGGYTVRCDPASRCS